MGRSKAFEIRERLSEQHDLVAVVYRTTLRHLARMPHALILTRNSDGLMLAERWHSMKHPPVMEGEFLLAIKRFGVEIRRS